LTWSWTIFFCFLFVSLLLALPEIIPNAKLSSLSQSGFDGLVFFSVSSLCLGQK
jgi:hypothetical protein